MHYFTSRLFYYSSIFLGLVLFSFVLFHVIPSDPARTILGPNADQNQVLQLRKQLGLDRPLPEDFSRRFAVKGRGYRLGIHNNYSLPYAGLYQAARQIAQQHHQRQTDIDGPESKT